MHDKALEAIGTGFTDAELRALATQSRELICRSDARGTLLHVNPRFHAATARGPGDALDALAADERARATIRALLDRAGASGRAEAHGLALRGAAGGELWVDVRLTRVGEALVWSLTDTTGERFLAEQARRQGELLDTAQEFGRLGLWERDFATGQGRWDHHVFRLWGLDPAGGTPSFDDAIAAIHPDDLDGVKDGNAALGIGRHSRRYRVLRADGQVRQVHSQWEVKAGPDGRPERAVGIMVDDTEVYEQARALDSVSAQLQLAVTLGEIYIWRHDLATGRFHYSDRCYEFLGIAPRPEGMPEAEVRQHIHPDDMPILEASRKNVRHDRPTDAEARYRRHDGQWRTMMVRRVSELDASGQVCGYIGVALDITGSIEARRRAEDLARRLDMASRAAGIGIWTSDSVTGETEWNAQMYELFDRLPMPNPTLRDWIELCVHPDDRQRVEIESRRAFHEGEGPYELECRTLRRSGEVRWMVLRATVEVTGAGHRRLLGVCIDFTDHYAALDALREAGERARLITRYAGIGTWETNLDGSDVVWDEQMFLLRGMTPRPRAPEMHERRDMVHPDDRHVLLDQRPRDHGVANLPQAYEFRVRLPDGRWRWLSSRSAVVLDATGKPVRRVGVNIDISEAREAETSRQQALLAEREVQAKTQFLSRMSHELRTPLNAVLGFTQLLQVEAQRAGQTAQLGKLAHIVNAGNHLLALVNDVLDLSGLESGELRLQKRVVDLAALVDEALPLVKPLADQHGVVIQLQGRAHAQADPTRLRQVLINLLSNAIKYNQREGRVLIDLSTEGEHAVVRVRDTGRGLTRAQLVRLFEPFNRFGAEREGIEGTGIGLVIVRALVHGMGGRIAVDSQPGRGTVFDVRLPAGVPEASPEAAPAGPAQTFAVDGPAVIRGRLLYIEDNPVNVLLVEELVRAVGGYVFASELTGESGVARVHRDQPDLVLVDLQLPDIDGYEVLRRLRADPATAGIRCVALSANALPEDIRRGLAAGFDDYWTKPIDFTVFTAALQRLLPGRA